MPRFCLPGYLVFALSCFVVPVSAATLITSASVTPGFIYTDNVCLTADDEQGEWIGIVTPAGKVDAESSRIKLSVDGSIQVNTLTDGKLEDLGCNPQGFGNREQFAPSLSANAGAIMVENWLFLDARANITQNSVTPFARGGNDPLNTNGNTNTTYDYAISPYIARRIRDLAVINLRYTWDDQVNSADVVGDSSEQRVDALLESVPNRSKFNWGLQGNYSKVSYSDTPGRATGEDNELKSAQINLGYQLDRAWQVNGFFGQEWNDFVSSQDDIDGTYWDVGLRWTPNGRTTVDVGAGERFFGNNPRFSISHRHKRHAFNANYARTLTYDRDIRTLADSPPLDPGFPPPPGVNPGETSLSNSPILDERFTIGYSYLARITGFGISGFYSDQTKQGRDDDFAFTESTFSGVSVSVERELSRKLSLQAGVNWNKQEPKDRGDGIGSLNVSETWIGTLSASRQLSTKLNLSLTYQYTDRQSDSAFDRALNEYTENRFTLDLRIDL